MSSSLQQDVLYVQLNNYVSLVTVTAVLYDYVLTFPTEVEYIWNKRWSWVSTLFILARYSGMSCVTLCAIWATSFLPDSQKMYECSFNSNLIHILGKLVTFQQMSECLPGNTIFVIAAWSFWTFMCSADYAVVMILRLWALYDRSKIILGALLTFYVMEIVFFFVIFVIYSKDSGYNSAAGTTQVLWTSVCVWGSISSAWGGILDAVQIALSSVMCGLIIIRFIKELRHVYKVAEKFHLNGYMKRLVREGIIYFFAMLVYALVNMLGRTLPWAGTSGWQIIPMGALEQTPPFILIPRFVLGLRELYAHDLRGRDIDTAFGLGSVSSQSARGSTVMFANTEENDEEEESIEGQVVEGSEGIRVVLHDD